MIDQDDITETFIKDDGKKGSAPDWKSNKLTRSISQQNLAI